MLWAEAEAVAAEAAAVEVLAEVDLQEDSLVAVDHHVAALEAVPLIDHVHVRLLMFTIIEVHAIMEVLVIQEVHEEGFLFYRILWSLLSLR